MEAVRSTANASASVTSRARIRMPLARSTSLRSSKRRLRSAKSSRSRASAAKRAFATWITDAQPLRRVAVDDVGWMPEPMARSILAASGSWVKTITGRGSPTASA